jgi:integrase
MAASARIIEFPGPQRPQPPRRVKNKELRTREHLTPDEVEAMIAAVRKAGGRVYKRDSLLLQMAYRHGLRATELCRLQWSQLDMDGGRFHVTRLKHGNPGTHLLQGPTLRMLRDWKRQQGSSDYVFTSMNGAPMAWSSVRSVVQLAGKLAGLSFPVHTHMLRHACGYYLANEGKDTRTIQEYLGHRSIGNTVRYTQLSAAKFKGLWPD